MNWIYEYLSLLWVTITVTIKTFYTYHGQSNHWMCNTVKEKMAIGPFLFFWWLKWSGSLSIHAQFSTCPAILFYYYNYFGLICYTNTRAKNSKVPRYRKTKSLFMSVIVVLGLLQVTRVRFIVHVYTTFLYTYFLLFKYIFWNMFIELVQTVKKVSSHGPSIADAGH